jgi:hypothetical protein
MLHINGSFHQSRCYNPNKRIYSFGSFPYLGVYCFFCRPDILSSVSFLQDNGCFLLDLKIIDFFQRPADLNLPLKNLKIPKAVHSYWSKPYLILKFE